MDKVTVQHYTDSVEIIINGNLNIHNTDKLLNAFKALLAEGMRFRVIGVNCSGLESIDSSGLGALISMSRQADSIKTEFYICDISKKISSLFDISNLNKYFQIITGDEFREIVRM